MLVFNITFVRAKDEILSSLEKGQFIISTKEIQSSGVTVDIDSLKQGLPGHYLQVQKELPIYY